MHNSWNGSDLSNNTVNFHNCSEYNAQTTVVPPSLHHNFKLISSTSAFFHVLILSFVLSCLLFTCELWIQYLSKCQNFLVVFGLTMISEQCQNLTKQNLCNKVTSSCLMNYYYACFQTRIWCGSYGTLYYYEKWHKSFVSLQMLRVNMLMISILGKSMMTTISEHPDFREFQFKLTRTAVGIWTHVLAI